MEYIKNIKNYKQVEIFLQMKKDMKCVPSEANFPLMFEALLDREK